MKRRERREIFVKIVVQHERGGRFQKLVDVSESQLKARRATRAKAVLERGEKIFEVEPVEVRSCNGGVAKACGSFLLFLGNEGIALGAKSSSVLGVCPFRAIV